MRGVKFNITDTYVDDYNIYLFGITENNERVIVKDAYPYYFLAQIEETADKDALIYQINGLAARESNTECKVVKTKLVSKKLLGEKKSFLKIFVNNKKAIKVIGDLIKELDGGLIKSYEKYYKHSKKYLFDKGITPLTNVIVKGRELEPSEGIDYYIQVDEIVQDKGEMKDYPLFCFDIETYNPGGVSSPDKDPIIMISYASSDGTEGVLTWKDNNEDYARMLSDEKSMLEEFIKILKKSKPAFVITYNGDNFDFPYLKKRCEEHGLDLKLGWDESSVRIVNRGVRGSSAKIRGLTHIDLYPFIITTMSNYLKTNTYTLNKVCKELLNEEKKGFDVNSLAKCWDEGSIEEALSYNLNDSRITLRLARKVLPLLYELTRIVGVKPSVINRVGYSKLVENYLMKETRSFEEVIMRKPTKDELRKRFRTSYKGGFVYEPEPGFYKNIAVFDFRSLYPSIITSHNICPTTLNAKGKSVHVSPDIRVNNEVNNFKFAKKPEGFIPSLIKGLITRRARIKKIIKGMDKSDENYSILSARQNAIKILANAMYGYLGFPQARWYSLECAASITAWGRHYINNVIERAEHAGLKVLYGDTDSCFFLLPESSVKKAKEFVKSVNANLPGMMELQFEGFFKTGIFVSKKGEKKGAKKKYALCTQDDELEIKGFELVRRDWSIVAKKLQKHLLEELLKDEDFNNALNLVKSQISRVKKGEVEIDDFVMKRKLTKKLTNYENITPHVAAAIKAKKAGEFIIPGVLINYVITQGRGRISDRAYTIKQVKEKGLKPDYDYYINNQLIPIVEEILKVIGFEESEIIRKEQRTLEKFV